jgi:hypothetical protein
VEDPDDRRERAHARSDRWSAGHREPGISRTPRVPGRAGSSLKAAAVLPIIWGGAAVVSGSVS